MDKVDDILAFVDVNPPNTDAGKIEAPCWPMLRSLAAEVRRLRAERDELRAALGNLVFTASKLWDDAKPIKDSATVHVTHPIIEQARVALSRTEGGEVRG